LVISCIIGGQSAVHVAHLLPDRVDSEIWPSFPSFMFEGLRSGETRRFPSPVPLPAGWQNVISDEGVIDVHHIPQPYRAMRFHVLRNDPRNKPRMNFRLACRADDVGEQSTDSGYCPGEDQIPRSRYLKAIRLELYGPDAGQFGLSYRCWSTRKGDGEYLVDHGDKFPDEWCGFDEPDHWVTRIVVRVKKLGSPYETGPALLQREDPS
jgi:hypothetical protein